MKQLVRLILISTVLAIVASADVTLGVFASLAPNRWGSPSYTGYVDNAVLALETGAQSAGDQSLPTGYSQISQEDALQGIVTNFNSWLGSADPTRAFAGELGNRLTYGVVVDGNGDQVSAGNLSFTMVSTDPLGTLSYGSPEKIDEYSADSSTGVYGTSGSSGAQVLYGFDGKKWVAVTDADSLYYDLVFVGMGNADDGSRFSSSPPTATDQDLIDAAAPAAPYTVTGTYTYESGASVVSASKTVDVVAPEPTSLILLVTMLAGVWVVRRKRFV